MNKVFFASCDECNIRDGVEINVIFYTVWAFNVCFDSEKLCSFLLDRFPGENYVPFFSLHQTHAYVAYVFR